MKIGKKTAVTKERTRLEKNRSNNIKRLTISLLAAVVLFLCLMVIQSSILNQEEKREVLQVIKDLPAGTKITEANIDEYLGTREVQISLIPENFITDESVVLGKFVSRTYKQRDVITEDSLLDTERIYRDSIDNPIEISMSAGSLELAVAGTLREGDYVNIYGLRRSDDIYKVDKYYTFKHVYITKVFDSNGHRVTTSDALYELTGDSLSTTLLSVIIDEKDAELFNEMLRNCDIRMAKLLYSTNEDYQKFITNANSSAAQSSVSTSNRQPEQTDSTNLENPQAYNQAVNDYINSLYGVSEEELEEGNLEGEDTEENSENEAENAENTEGIEGTEEEQQPAEGQPAEGQPAEGQVVLPDSSQSTESTEQPTEGEQQ